MPLRDHFHNPLKDYCPWSSVHSNWGTKMVDRLNGDRLSENFRAQAASHFGAQLEADIATLERSERGSLFEDVNGHDGGVATATKTEVYSPPAAVLSATIEFDDPDLFEVKIFRGSGGWELVAVVELVSEANKDREEHRQAFAVKCGSYLQKGISVVVVDTVTTYSANLHNELCELIGAAEPLRWSPPNGLSVVVYRANRVANNGGTRLNVWPYPLALKSPLPTVPLWLAADLAVPLELELTYEAACKSLRVA
ncbi:Uncharacterized protein OS=Candidatus Entotheonella sp. TSY1 GN=ETSY1_33795 PE=4 SV=1 [Gemmataceae bacterium]|nr:Uncharacterized protein OS=Candidatus Entotheonella sp. TSY1 GN=ETSY1_33795 PE=4 SV=1 [Gemmataceae bacterium]VTU02010.1 Uncharacterized protein OS=Candidatus Entotheonella sp. TSY1 GN=ETSY1_33795 PE=4 SV=1 [Gemmataceae bacterium]